MDETTPIDEIPMAGESLDDQQDRHHDMEPPPHIQQQMMQQQMMQQQMQQQQQQQQEQQPSSNSGSGGWTNPKFLFSEFKSSIIFAILFFVFAYLFRVSSLKTYVPQLFDSNGAAGVMAKSAHALLGGIVFYFVNRFTPKNFGMN